MLIPQVKAREALEDALQGRLFLLLCHGCREIYFPEEEAAALLRELGSEGRVAGSLTTDYICDPVNLRLRLEGRRAGIDAADTVLVLACGVGVQTAAETLPEKRVLAGCDTYPLPGYQGLTPTEADCAGCGQCYLNLTGGICPVTACAKGLLNGPCGGAKAGQCEAEPERECGWERIYRRLERLGRVDARGFPVQLRDYGIESQNRSGTT